jgi:hypothetical protein
MTGLAVLLLSQLPPLPPESAPGKQVDEDTGRGLVKLLPLLPR